MRHKKTFLGGPDVGPPAPGEDRSNADPNSLEYYAALGAATGRALRPIVIGWAVWYFLIRKKKK